MNMYGEKPESIVIPVGEYKDLLAAKMELEIIYHKLESCTGTTEKYTFHEFVENVREALHPARPDAEIPVPVIPGTAVIPDTDGPLVAMHAQDAVRSVNA